MITTSVAAESEFADVQQLLDAFLGEAGEGDLDAESSRRVRQAVARGEIRFLVARADGRPVGLVSLTTGFTTYRAAPFGMLDDLFVVPSWRGRGVARRLIEAALEHARDAGCRTLMAGCAARDVAMWLHLGYRPIGQLMSSDL